MFLGEDEPFLLDRAEAQGARLVELGEAPFRKASYRERPGGLLATAPQFPARLDALKPGSNPLFLTVEGIEKPGNLGTMLRTADAAGADGVIVCDPTTDVFNPNVVRASLGALFAVDVAVTTTEEAIDWLAARHIQSVAATPSGTIEYYEADYRAPCAVCIGSEQLGLSDAFLEAATATVRIGMQGSMDSLNAAIAGAVVLFEAVRQRSTVPP